MCEKRNIPLINFRKAEYLCNKETGVLPPNFYFKYHYIPICEFSFWQYKQSIKESHQVDFCLGEFLRINILSPTRITGKLARAKL